MNPHSFNFRRCVPPVQPCQQSSVLNENITVCLVGPGKIPIISLSSQPNLLPAHPHPSVIQTVPSVPGHFVSPFPHFQCFPLAVRMPECQPNMFCSQPVDQAAFLHLPVTFQLYAVIFQLHLASQSPLAESKMSDPL